MKNLGLIQSVVNKHIKGCYQLPVVEGRKMYYIIPLSGGIDSFSVGYVLTALFPEVNFLFLHADTGIEASGTEEAFEKFQDITGTKLQVISSKYDLLTMIEKSGNYLPSQRNRSCTAAVKTTPIKAFFKMARAKYGDDALFCQFVGLRADEPTREGITWTQDYIVSAYPLQALGLTKSDVNKIVNEIQGIPTYYKEKSRSGCQICLFHRRSEIINSWQVAPTTMIRAANMEEMPDNILTIYNAMPTPISDLLNYPDFYLKYYRPSRLGHPSTTFEDVRGKKKIHSSMDDLFGGSEAKMLYVAVEYDFYSDGYTGLVDKEQIITYSTSLSGIKKALKFFWIHRLQTSAMYDLSDMGMRHRKQLQIIQIEVDNYDAEIPPKPEDKFVWQNDNTPLYAIRKAVSVIERILKTEGVEQDAKHEDKRVSEVAKEHLAILNKEQSYGRIVSSMNYTPLLREDLIEDADIEDAPVPCMACAR